MPNLRKLLMVLLCAVCGTAAGKPTPQKRNEKIPQGLPGMAGMAGLYGEPLT